MLSIIFFPLGHSGYDERAFASFDEAAIGVPGYEIEFVGIGGEGLRWMRRAGWGELLSGRRTRRARWEIS